jgi:hypothetical protein
MITDIKKSYLAVVTALALAFNGLSMPNLEAFSLSGMFHAAAGMAKKAASAAAGALKKVAVKLIGVIGEQLKKFGATLIAKAKQIFGTKVEAIIAKFAGGGGGAAAAN